MTASDPKETVNLRVILVLVAALSLANCAVGGSEKEAVVGSTDQFHAHSASLDLYKMIQCAGCETDFRRVAVPDNYELPKEKLGTCFAYVLDQNPESRDLLLSAWMECVEAASENAN